MKLKAELHSERITLYPLPNNETRGYGRGYANDPKGSWWIAAVADCHWPTFYAFREDTFENAYDLAAGALCEAMTPSDYGLTEAEMQAQLESGKLSTHYLDGSGPDTPYGVDTDYLTLREWIPMGDRWAS